MHGTDSLCPKSKGKFENISLSRRALTCHVELIDKDILSELNKKVQSFTLYSLALNESNNMKEG